MPTTNIKITGEKELLAKFQALQKATQGAVLANSAKAGILPIQDEAVVIVVKVSGNLSRSIHTELIETSQTYAEAASGTDVEYAAVIEFGLPGTKRVAKPYMRPAFDTKRNDAVAETRASLVQLIEAAAQ